MSTTIGRCSSPGEAIEERNRNMSATRTMGSPAHTRAASALPPSPVDAPEALTPANHAWTSVEHAGAKNWAPAAALEACAAAQAATGAAPTAEAPSGTRTPPLLAADAFRSCHAADAGTRTAAPGPSRKVPERTRTCADSAALKNTACRFAAVKGNGDTDGVGGARTAACPIEPGTTTTEAPPGNALESASCEVMPDTNASEDDDSAVMNPSTPEPPKPEKTKTTFTDTLAPRSREVWRLGVWWSLRSRLAPAVVSAAYKVAPVAASVTL